MLNDPNLRLLLQRSEKTNRGADIQKICREQLSQEKNTLWCKVSFIFPTALLLIVRTNLSFWYINRSDKIFIVTELITHLYWPLISVIRKKIKFLQRIKIHPNWCHGNRYIVWLSLFCPGHRPASHVVGNNEWQLTQTQLSQTRKQRKRCQPLLHGKWCSLHHRQRELLHTVCVDTLDIVYTLMNVQLN